MKRTNNKVGSTTDKGGQTESKTASANLKRDQKSTAMAKTTEAKKPIAFTAADKKALKQQEERITNNIGGFLVLGEALAAIQERELHKVNYADLSFEEYCENRWGFGRAYGYRLIGAYKCVAHLKSELGPQGVLVFPTNEAQVRPLTGMKPVEQLKTWKQVVRMAKGGTITAGLVEKVAGGRRSGSETSTMKPDADPTITARAKAEHRKLIVIGKLIAKAKAIARPKLTVDKLLEILNQIETQIQDVDA